MVESTVSHSISTYKVPAATSRRDRLPSAIRPEIEKSWRRCQAIGVQPEVSAIPYTDETETDSRIMRAALPVMDSLAHQLSESPVTFLLTDHEGTILDRRAGQQSLLRTLDNAHVATGFTYSESYVGTNAIGTALSERQGFKVRGDEHMLNSLQNLACVGAPIQDPASGKVVGILDITSEVQDANDLMSPLVSNAVRDIENRYFAGSALSEQRLLREYVRARRRTGAVVALRRDTVIATPEASRLMDSTDSMMLWEWASGFLANREEWLGELSLAEGVQVKVRARRIGGLGESLSVLLELRPIGLAGYRPTYAAKQASPAPKRRTRVSRGLPSRSPLGGRLQWQVEKIADTVEPALVTGEAGVGKAHIAQYIHQLWGATDPVPVVDGADLTRQGVVDLRSRLEEGAPVILKHLDRVPENVVDQIRRLLDEALAEGRRVIATAANNLPSGPAGQLTLHLDRRVGVAPLRQRLEDLTIIARELLVRRLPDRPTPRLHSAAHHALAAHDWPGNIRELEAVLGAAVIRSMGFDIRVEHLPDEYRSKHSGPRRSSLETAERLTIIQVLEEVQGNKSMAAHRLGIARSTLYRKMRSLKLE